MLATHKTSPYFYACAKYNTRVATQKFWFLLRTVMHCRILPIIQLQMNEVARCTTGITQLAVPFLHAVF